MISAVVLAAGLSRRMGSFKLLLPWGGRTVVAQVVETLRAAAVGDIVVVTGHRAAEVEAALAGTAAHIVPNQWYAEGEMIGSIQAGLSALAALEPPPGAALLCLGDQPQMELSTVLAVLAAGSEAGNARIVVPSYRMRAGHPILLPRAYWPAILASPEPLRACMAAHRDAIDYVTVDTPTVLADLDTPEDYEREQPRAGR